MKSPETPIPTHKAGMSAWLYSLEMRELLMDNRDLYLQQVVTVACLRNLVIMQSTCGKASRSVHDVFIFVQQLFFILLMYRKLMNTTLLTM